jgi:1-deoxy-D-xylulose 5-phosphate reductoisomerase
VIERVLERTPKVRMTSIEEVLAADSEARRMAREEVERKAARTAVA